MAEISWTDAQWQKVNEAVTAAFGQASVASALGLPCYGPLPGGSESVRNELLKQDDKDATVSLDVNHASLNLRFVNLQVRVELSSEQVADETMMNALLVFRRAANILAQHEDQIVFDGYQRGSGQPSPYVSNAPGPQKGLADPLERLDRSRFPLIPGASIATTDRDLGGLIVPAVVSAIQRLERNSNPGPFACILGTRLYQAVYTPNDNLVLPAERIVPILGGPLLRSGQMNEFTGIVVSRSAGALDIVIGTPPTAQFLQRSRDGKYLFRVYERFVLRIRDQGRDPAPGQGAAQGPAPNQGAANLDTQPVAGFIAPDNGVGEQGIAGAQLELKAAREDVAKALQKLSLAADRMNEAANLNP